MISSEPNRHTRSIDFEAMKRVSTFLRDPLETERPSDLPRMEAYELHEHLGTGASGSVYMATPKASPEMVVAVKLFKSTAEGGPAPPRVLRELDLLSALQLPCVPLIHDFGVDQGRFFIVTEVIRGTQLDHYCEESDLSLRDRVRLLIAVASRVQQLHEVGVIHRDIKPSNIMVTHVGNPVLIDFGIAAILEAESHGSFTAEGVPIGSPGFMAPEQARGERLATTIRSDVFAIGATACYTLTGSTPHETQGPFHAVIRRIADDPPRRPEQLDSALPRGLAAILAKATAFDPRDRFASAGEFATFLSRWLDGEPIELAKPSLLSRLIYRVRRHPWMTTSSATAVIACLAAIFLGFAAAAESRLADEQRVVAMEQSQLAQEQSQLAEERRLLAEEREQAVLTANALLEKVRNTVRQFIQGARTHGERGSIGEALSLIAAIDHLIQTEDLRDPELIAEHRDARVDTILLALHNIYRTSEFGGADTVERIRTALDELEQQRMEAQPDRR